MSQTTPLTFDILLALADEDRHGYGLIKEIEAQGGSAPSTGAMYLALRRMEAGELIEEASERPSEADDARRRYYRITRRGREVAEMESIRLAGLVATARAKNLLTGATAGGREQ